MNNIVDKIKLNWTNNKVDELRSRLIRICKELSKSCDLNVADVYCNGFDYKDRHHNTIYIQDLFELAIDDKFYYADLEITISSDEHNRIKFEFEKMVSEEISQNWMVDEMLDRVFIDCCYKKYAEVSKQLWLLNDEDLYERHYFEFEYFDKKKTIHDMDYNAVISLLIHIYKAAKKCGGKSTVYPKGY